VDVFIAEILDPDTAEVVQLLGMKVVEVLQWLRQQGAQWPPVLQRNGRLWIDAAVVWARAEGCTSPLQ
jgi:hypothetical protein